jgi:iron complex outermembrane receptor protein
MMKQEFQGRHSGRTVLFGLVCAALAQVAAAASDDPFFDLNLNEVLNLEITSVSKKPQTISQAAAAVFVITGDDIRRSGVTTIADALRMAPGVQVGQISANTWAVSARGMNGRFTNKLLVLMDGRSVYTPTFSGVYWDVQDTVLADIERIEVIRGPGAALWGANAVNGVINIITKSAAATQGGLVTAASGNEESASASVRYGGKAGEIGHWRVYAKGFERDESLVRATGADGNDYWRQQRTGFRTDLAPGGADSVTLQGDYYSGRSGDTATLNFLTPPFNTTLGVSQKVSGGNLLGRWQRDVSATDSFTLQAYFDHTQRDWPAHLNESRNTYDLDFQYRTRRFKGHDLVLGAGYRLNRDRIDRSYTGIPANALHFSTFSPASASRQLYSALIQDDITLMPDKLVLTLGTKLEHNDYTGMEWQPNARLLWTPGDTTTVWGSVARAVRTPSRIDRGGVVNQTVVPPRSAQNPLPLPVLIQATGEIESESLIAYEAGWKQRLAPTLSVDLALFYNDYDKLRTGRFLAPVCQPSGLPVAAGCFMMPFQTSVLQSSPAGNLAKGWSHGIELAADWRPLTNLRFQSALSQFAMEMREQSNAFTTDREGSAPRLQGSLRMSWNPRPDADVDLWLRRIGRLDEVTEGISIPGYTQLDLRLAWRPSKTFELALVGRNLLDRKHPEFASELLDGPMTELQRSVFGQVTLRF